MVRAARCVEAAKMRPWYGRMQGIPTPAPESDERDPIHPAWGLAAEQPERRRHHVDRPTWRPLHGPIPQKGDQHVFAVMRTMGRTMRNQLTRAWRGGKARDLHQRAGIVAVPHRGEQDDDGHRECVIGT